MNKILYVHIGTGKTGTTALQDFFLLNQEALRAAGINYCATGLVKNNHHLVCRNFERDNEATQQKVTENLLKLNFEIQESNCPFHLISSEYFPGMTREEILELSESMDAEVVPIVYLRRQDEFLESWYAQIVKAYNVKSDIHSLMHRLEKEKILDYRSLVEGWAVVNSGGIVRVRPYEKDSFIGGSIFSDFLSAIDSGVGLEALKIPVRDPNPSIRPAQIRMGMKLYDYCSEKQRKVIFSSFPEVKDSSRFFLSRSERQDLIDRYSSINAYVAKKFLGKELLFLELDAPEEKECSDFSFLEGFVLTLFMEYPESLQEIEEPLVKLLKLEAGNARNGDLQRAMDYLKLALLVRPDGPHIRNMLKSCINA
ncbi:hypothetical protein [Microbulbifer sp. JSM ZJ756]|uniref:hypothetical protein n=1 Tax=Microbulbifer sp. JSM ZJ756 TaxID=3376191 RepID=UPI0037B7B1C5